MSSISKETVKKCLEKGDYSLKLTNILKWSYRSAMMNRSLNGGRIDLWSFPGIGFNVNTDYCLFACSLFCMTFLKNVSFPFLDFLVWLSLCFVSQPVRRRQSESSHRLGGFWKLDDSNYHGTQSMHLSFWETGSSKHYKFIFSFFSFFNLFCFYSRLLVILYIWNVLFFDLSYWPYYLFLIIFVYDVIISNLFCWLFDLFEI